VFAEHLARGGDHDDLLQRYRERATLAELGGQAPTGVFSTLERERHRRVLECWMTHLESMGGAQRSWSTVGFGRARDDAPITELVPPIIVPVTVGEVSIDVEVHGTTDPIDRGALGSLVLVASGRTHRRHVLRGFVDHLALSASGVAAGEAHATTIITGGDKRARHRFLPWSQEDARGYLSELVGELLGGPHDYLLPCEAVFEHHKNPKRALADIVDDLLRKPRATMSSRYGPVSRLDGLRAPDAAESVAERRFGAFYERMEELRE
jgi:exodeoxyribonuclease V gamma subunit